MPLPERIWVGPLDNNHEWRADVEVLLVGLVRLVYRSFIIYVFLLVWVNNAKFVGGKATEEGDVFIVLGRRIKFPLGH